MEMCQDRDYAVVVACTEVQDFVKLTELLGYLWNVKDLRIVTGPAPERVFAEQGDAVIRDRFRESIDESLRCQSTKRIALVAHDGCTMNAVSYEEQIAMLRRSVDHLMAQHPDTKVAGIWLDETGTPLKVDF